MNTCSPCNKSVGSRCFPGCNCPVSVPTHNPTTDQPSTTNNHHHHTYPNLQTRPRKLYRRKHILPASTLETALHARAVSATLSLFTRPHARQQSRKLTNRGGGAWLAERITQAQIHRSYDTSVTAASSQRRRARYCNRSLLPLRREVRQSAEQSRRETRSPGHRSPSSSRGRCPSQTDQDGPGPASACIEALFWI